MCSDTEAIPAQQCVAIPFPARQCPQVNIRRVIVIGPPVVCLPDRAYCLTCVLHGSPTISIWCLSPSTFYSIQFCCRILASAEIREYSRLLLPSSPYYDSDCRLRGQDALLQSLPEAAFKCRIVFYTLRSIRHCCDSFSLHNQSQDRRMTEHIHVSLYTTLTVLKKCYSVIYDVTEVHLPYFNQISCWILSNLQRLYVKQGPEEAIWKWWGISIRPMVVICSHSDRSL